MHKYIYQCISGIFEAPQNHLRFGDGNALVPLVDSSNRVYSIVLTSLEVYSNENFNYSLDKVKTINR